MSAIKEIEEMMAEYDQAHDAGDGAKLTSFFLDDAIIIPPEKPKLEGRMEIDEFFSAVSGGSNMKTISANIEVDKKMAYVQGETEWQSNGELKYLYFVDVLFATDNGWRYKLLTWNTSSGLSRT